jgi:hypothetical protein
MEFHIEVVAERAMRAYAETLDATTSIQVYGEPSDAVVGLEMLSRQAGADGASCRRVAPPHRGAASA